MSAPLTSPAASPLVSARPAVKPPSRAPAHIQARPKGFADQLREAHAQARLTAQTMARTRDAGQDRKADTPAFDQGARAEQALFDAADPTPDPARPADAQALDLAHEEDARAFGFAELGLLGHGFVTRAGAETTTPPGEAAHGPPPLETTVKTAPLGSSLAPAAIAPVILASSGAAPSSPRAPTTRSWPPAAKLEGDPRCVEPEAGGEEAQIDGPDAAHDTPGGAPAPPPARRAAASVAVAEGEGQLHVAIGAASLSPDEETRLRQGVDAALAEAGARPGEIHINGRTARRPAPHGRQG